MKKIVEEILKAVLMLFAATLGGLITWMLGLSLVGGFDAPNQIDALLLGLATTALAAIFGPATSTMPDIWPRIRPVALRRSLEAFAVSTGISLIGLGAMSMLIHPIPGAVPVPIVVPLFAGIASALVLIRVVRVLAKWHSLTWTDFPAQVLKGLWSLILFVMLTLAANGVVALLKPMVKP